MGYDVYIKNPVKGDEPDYFHRTIWIRAFCDTLVAYGMGFYSPTPPWPKSPSPFENHVRYDEDTDEEIGLTQDGRHYLERCAHIIWTHGETTTPGIPLHKFSSNDGWHVTRIECAQALEAYEKALPRLGHPEEFRDDFIPFLHVAVKRDGFTVH